MWLIYLSCTTMLCIKLIMMLLPKHKLDRSKHHNVAVCRNTVTTPPSPLLVLPAALPPPSMLRLMQGAAPALGSWPGRHGTGALGPQQPPPCRGWPLHLVVGRLASPVTKAANHPAAKLAQVWLFTFCAWNHDSLMLRTVVHNYIMISLWAATS